MSPFIVHHFVPSVNPNNDKCATCGTKKDEILHYKTPKKKPSAEARTRHN